MIVYFKQTFHQLSLSRLKLPILSYSMHKKQTQKQIKKIPKSSQCGRQDIVIRKPVI